MPSLYDFPLALESKSVLPVLLTNLHIFFGNMSSFMHIFPSFLCFCHMFWIYLDMYYLKIYILCILIHNIWILDSFVWILWIWIHNQIMIYKYTLCYHRQSFCSVSAKRCRKILLIIESWMDMGDDEMDAGMDLSLPAWATPSCACNPFLPASRTESSE